MNMTYTYKVEKMRIKNIETSYGKFPSLSHFERYWESKIGKAYKNGFDAGYIHYCEIHKS